MRTNRTKGWAVALLVAGLAGCTQHEPPKYEAATPGGGLSGTSSGTAPGGSRIGLVTNANTEASLKDSKAVHESLGSVVIVNTSAQQDIDPTYVHARILSALKRRYPDVRVSDSLAASAAAGNPSTVIVDVRTFLGKRSGDKSRIEINLVFYDRAKRVVARVGGRGEGTIPYPAWDFGLQTAADQAIAEISARL